MEDEEKKFPLPFEHPDFYDWQVPITYDNDNGMFYMQACMLGDWNPLIDDSLEEWSVNAYRFDLKNQKNIQPFRHFFKKVLETVKEKDFKLTFNYTYYSHLSLCFSDYAIDVSFIKNMMEPDGVVVYETSDWTKVCLVYNIHWYLFRKMWQAYLDQNTDGECVKGTQNWYGRYESDEPFPMPPQEFQQHTGAFGDGWRFMSRNGYKWLAQGKPYHDTGDYWYWPISYIKEMVQ